MENPDLSFLQLKIANIGTALFFCGANSLLPFRAYIITALKTDSEGCIWFFISRAWNTPVTYGVNFPASLEFYRKGYPFSLRIEGDGQLENKTAVLQELMGKSVSVKEEALAGVLLVKVKIQNAIYKELFVPKPFAALETCVAAIKNWLYPAPGKKYGLLQWQPSI
jgi:hypothetical protein